MEYNILYLEMLLIVVRATTAEILFIPRFGLQYSAANCARPQEGEGFVPQKIFYFSVIFSGWSQ